MILRISFTSVSCGSDVLVFFVHQHHIVTKKRFLRRLVSAAVSTQHIFITQTGIDTAIELKSHLRKDKTSKDNNKNNLKSKMDNIMLALSY
jgi:hypothetical protein